MFVEKTMSNNSLSLAEKKVEPKPSRKIESINKAFCFDIENGLRNIFLGIKLHQDRKLKLSESV